MFFLLSKIGYYLINPGLWLILLLVYVLIGKNEKLKRKFILLSVFLLLVFANPILIDKVIGLWEVPNVSLNSIGNYDVGIVLGTVAKYDSSLDRIQFEPRADRLFQAIELYKKGKIRKILYSGGAGSIMHPMDKDGPWIRRYLITVGVPEQDVFIENESHNTHENALMAKPILDQIAPDGRYLLITSAFHMRRSLLCFEKLGIPVDPYSTDRLGGPLKIDLDKIMIPDLSSFGDWHTLNHELLGYLIYKMAGYI